MKAIRVGLLTGIIALTIPFYAAGQNTTFAGAVPLVAGQPAMRVTLASGSADRFYSAEVVAGRSYCAEATGSDTEHNGTDPTLTVFRADQSTAVGTDSGADEPRSLVAARVCFVAPGSEGIFIKLSPENAAFENREYALRFVETTLWANWFFVGGGYSSYALLRNTTGSPVTVTVVLRSESGAQVGLVPNQVIPPNGTFYRDVRQIMGCVIPAPCPTIAGSVEVAHNGSPEAIVGSQTTLSSQTGLSFDTLMFQRKPW